MTTLTTYLDDVEVTNWPTHPVCVSCPSPGASTHAPHSQCVGCAQVEVAGHESVVASSWDTTGASLFSRAVARNTMRLVQRVQRDLCGLLGTAFGDARWEDYGGVGTVNFADAVTWNIVEADGTRLTLALAGDADPRDVHLWFEPVTGDWEGTTLVSHRGCAVMPGDVVAFNGPSALAWTSFPTVLSVRRVTGNQVELNLDADVTACTTNAGFDPAPETYTCATWRHAGAPELWPVVCDPVWARCKHCVRDYSASIQRFTAEGTATGTDGKVWFCARRRYQTTEYDEEGNPTTTINTPTGLPRFAAVCNARDCDQYEALPESGDGVFTVRWAYARWLRALWGGADTRLQSLAPATGYSPISRIAHPSIASLCGVWTEANPAGDSNPWPTGSGGTYQWPGVGCVCEIEEVTDPTDGILARSRTGWEWDIGSVDPTTVDLMDDATYPEAGHASRLVTGYTSLLSPLDRAAALDDTLDPYYTARQGTPRSRIGWTRDAGATTGRGVYQHGHALPTEPIILPRIVLDAAGTQTRGLASYTLGAVTVLGTAYAATIALSPLRTTGKTETAIATRTVAATGTTGGVHWCDLAHDTHSAVWTDTSVTPNVQVTKTWTAGGGAGFRPPTWAQSQSGCDVAEDCVEPCDGAAFSTAALSGLRFVVLSATPFGGVEDRTWNLTNGQPGETTPYNPAILGTDATYSAFAGYRDRFEYANEAGHGAPSAGDTVTFYSAATVWLEPATLYWTAADADAWTEVTEAVLYDSAAGKIYLSDAALAEMVGNENGEVCLKL